jgi:hypothetical protein
MAGFAGFTGKRYLYIIYIGAENHEILSKNKVFLGAKRRK